MKKYTIRHDKNEQRTLKSDGKLALGITIGVLGVIISYLGYEYISNENGDLEFFLVAPLIISLLVALASTYFSANALMEQRRAREAGTDPVLIAHLGQREDARELVTFNISNVGAGAALKVQLDADEPHDNKEDLEKRNYVQNIFCPRVPFTVIRQGQSIEFNLALGWHLLGQETTKEIDQNLPISPLPPFQVRLSYEDLAGGQYESEFTIDVRELQGLGAHKSPKMRIVSAIEKIANKP
jgi:hypothetical protein